MNIFSKFKDAKMQKLLLTTHVYQNFTSK